MSRKYQIWDHASNVITPSNEIFTPEMWSSRYPALCLEGATMVIAAGFYNGGLIGELSVMKKQAEQMGATFDESLTGDSLLQAIEDFEDELAKGKDEISEPTAEERIAAALEYQNMVSL